MAELPYDTETPAEWVKQVDSWAWVADRNDAGRARAWSKRGDCPRCGHVMTVRIGITRGVNPERPVDAWCNCAVIHQEGLEGCGQAAEVERPRA